MKIRHCDTPPICMMVTVQHEHDKDIYIHIDRNTNTQTNIHKTYIPIEINNTEICTSNIHTIIQILHITKNHKPYNKINEQDIAIYSPV